MSTECYEIRVPIMIKADPSQGSHFFQNITSLGIPYVTVTEKTDDTLDWQWLKSLPVVAETAHLKHVRVKLRCGLVPISIHS